MWYNGARHEGRRGGFLYAVENKPPHRKHEMPHTSEAVMRIFYLKVNNP